MLALNLLDVSLIRAVPVRVQMPCIRAPMSGIEAVETKGLQECLELHKDLIFAATTDIRQDRARVMLKRMPQPANRATTSFTLVGSLCDFTL